MSEPISATLTDGTADNGPTPAAVGGEPRSPAGRRLAVAVVVGALAAAAAFGAGVLLGAGSTQSSDPTADLPAAGATATSGLSAQLAYLAEEEKLAHDLYVLGESLYGDRVFANISRSETQHQASVRELLASYDVPDPTQATAPGVFTDPGLQALYDTLAARMGTSEAEAALVGVVVEETDIADLREALASEPPADVREVLERLEAASQNHLRAFTRYSERA